MYFAKILQIVYSKIDRELSTGLVLAAYTNHWDSQDVYWRISVDIVNGLNASFMYSKIIVCNYSTYMNSLRSPCNNYI